MLLFTVLMGMAWGITGRGVMKQVAIATAAAAAAFTFLPYSLDRMGLDVRLLLVANLPALAVGWGLARYTPLGTARRTAILGGSAFLLALTHQGDERCLLSRVHASVPRP